MGHLKVFPSQKKKRRLPKSLQIINSRRKNNACETTRKSSVSSQPTSLCGRRIISVCEFLEQIKELNNHSPIGCTFSNMQFLREKRLGLTSGFVFKCEMCNFEKIVWSEKKTNILMDVNTSAVSGTMTTGGGHAQLEEVLSTMDIPSMSNKTYKKFEDNVSAGLMATAEAEMKKAAEEEARHAVERGDVDKDGTPLLTVVADGSWCKRSYRTNYSSLSGVAAIVGHHTKKVLYMGVKNKYCTPCTRAATLDVEPKPHSCFKNWGTEQSSSSMEPAIIADGFLRSEEMYGVKFARLIADGDSSVYKKVLESRPYKTTTVEKIECKNHLLRNFATKLRQIATTSNRAQNTVFMRKKLGNNVFRCRMAAQKALVYRKKQDISVPEKIKEIRLDIINIPSHVFGEHKQCKQRGYFCKLDAVDASEENNIVPELIAAGLYRQVSDVVRDLSRHSRSLITDVTSNSVEHYNSIVAKFIGGKRINFALRGSYQGRCSAAVLQHNTGNSHYILHKQMYSSSPGFYAKSTGTKRKRKVEKGRVNKKSKRSLFPPTNGDADYGPAAQRPDIEDSVMANESSEFLDGLRKSEEDIVQIERDTVEQSDSGMWLEVRRQLLTASNFGRVCKMKPTTGCEALVKQLLYSTFDCEAMAYGRQHEDLARQEVSSKLDKTIQPCGLFIDAEKPFLGASPDGLIDEDGVVEIKCPASARDMTPNEAILNKKVNFWSTSKTGKIGGLNKNHDYFFQIQGQLHVTKRRYCQFALWTPKGLKLERIERDDTFWDKHMVSKLETFYFHCILPEIIDPRHSRSMPIRNPSYILEARKCLEDKKKKKNVPLLENKNKPLTSS